MWSTFLLVYTFFALISLHCILGLPFLQSIEAGPKMNTYQSPYACKNYSWWVYEIVSLSSWLVTFMNSNWIIKSQRQLSGYIIFSLMRCVCSFTTEQLMIFAFSASQNGSVRSKFCSHKCWEFGSLIHAFENALNTRFVRKKLQCNSITTMVTG